MHGQIYALDVGHLALEKSFAAPHSVQAILHLEKALLHRIPVQQARNGWADWPITRAMRDKAH